MITMVKHLTAGHCLQKEFFVRKDGRWKEIKFPASVVLIQHQQHGLILFDTGYSTDIYDQTKYLPERLYRLLVPPFITVEETALEQIKAMGFNARDVSHVIISHFHADHISGLKDFPFSKYVFMKEGLTLFLEKSRWQSTAKAVIQATIPEHLCQQGVILGNEDFQQQLTIGTEQFSAFDLFQDGSLLLVPLPGHALGHMGLYVKAATQDYFFIADACWDYVALKRNIAPRSVVRLVTEDYGAYLNTFQKLHHTTQTAPQTLIIPCHCHQVKRVDL